MTDEMKRLKVVEKEKNSRKPWNGRTPAIDPSHAKRLDLGATATKKEYSGPSPMALAAKERAYARIQEKANRGKKKLTKLEIVIREVDEVAKSKKRGIHFAAAEVSPLMKSGPTFLFLTSYSS